MYDHATGRVESPTLAEMARAKGYAPLATQLQGDIAVRHLASAPDVHGTTATLSLVAALTESLRAVPEGPVFSNGVTPCRARGAGVPPGPEVAKPQR